MTKKQYGTGLIRIAPFFDDLSLLAEIKQCASQCEKFIVVLPDDVTLARVGYTVKEGTASQGAEILRDITWIDEVVICDAKQGTLPQLYVTYKFDVYFFGNYYGRQYVQDKKWIESQGGVCLPLLPVTGAVDSQVDALRLALINKPRDEKIILFGTGAYFALYMQKYGKEFPPAYAVDNNKEQWGNKKQGVPVCAPEILAKEDLDKIFIVICAKNYTSILQQLHESGQENCRTMVYHNTIAIWYEWAVAQQREVVYLEKARNVLLKLLTEFDRVCQKHKIKYYLICGSLIGAVRHQGFIPWDDDVDIAISRSDFLKLQQIAKNEWSGGQYVMLDYHEQTRHSFFDFLARFIYLSEELPTMVFDKAGDTVQESCKHKVFLDIYVMDNACDNQFVHMTIMYIMKALYALCMGHRGKIDYAEYQSLPFCFYWALRAAHFVGRIIPLKLLTGAYIKCAQLFNNTTCANYFMGGCTPNCIERKFNKEFFGSGQRVPFAEIETSIPQDYDGLLHAMGYSSYMQLPPMKIRKPSHYFTSDIVTWR